ncbi:hypothetical protein, partial [Yersinia rochesterensis]|uniref:hypothetical protein n=1 Tax=Yersinia rochesterensis TaxID=1604335 RepID=UPI001C96368F
MIHISLNRDQLSDIKKALCAAEGFSLFLFHIAKTPRFWHGVSALFDAWQCPTLAWGDPTLPSALRRFTSEFGM